MGGPAEPGSPDPLVQWLVSDGRLGQPVDYYSLVVTAQWLGVPPWTLAGLDHTAGRPWWFAWADRVRRAMNQAQHELSLKAARGARR